MIKEEGEEEEEEEEEQDLDEEELEEEADNDVRSENKDAETRRSDGRAPVENNVSVDETSVPEPPVPLRRAGELGYSLLEGQEATDQDEQEAPEASSTCSSDLSFGGTSSGTLFSLALSLPKSNTA